MPIKLFAQLVTFQDSFKCLIWNGTLVLKRRRSLPFYRLNFYHLKFTTFPHFGLITRFLPLTEHTFRICGLTRYSAILAHYTQVFCGKSNFA